jgi:hypothetical protein
MVLVGNLVSCLMVKTETESVTPDTAFRFNSKDLLFQVYSSCFYLSSKLNFLLCED